MVFSIRSHGCTWCCVWLGDLSDFHVFHVKSYLHQPHIYSHGAQIAKDIIFTKLIYSRGALISVNIFIDFIELVYSQRAQIPETLFFRLKFVVITQRKMILKIFCHQSHIAGSKEDSVELMHNFNLFRIYYHNDCRNISYEMHLNYLDGQSFRKIAFNIFTRNQWEHQSLLSIDY